MKSQIKIIASALALSMADAATEHHKHQYKSFASAIGQFEYDWEPFTTTTDDGYYLTMFRLQGPIGHYPVHRTAVQSILLSPGLGMSADSWFPSPEHGEPMPIQLYEAGYDVWLANPRGTPHSRGHIKYDPEHNVDDAQHYWDWSFAEIGTYDNPAMLKHIKYIISQEVEEPFIRHTDKIVFIGYDQGATSMLYSLAYKENDLHDYLRGAIMLAPCTKMNILGGTTGYHYYQDIYKNIELIGLEAMYGQNWETYKPEICAHLGKMWCEQETVWKQEPFSTKALAHFFQNGIENKFQEYSELYPVRKEFRITSDIPLGNIQKTPIAVFYGDADRVCPMDQTEWMLGRIGKMVYGNYQFGGYSHADFGIANDHVFMNELHEALSHLRPLDHDHHMHTFEPSRLTEDASEPRRGTLKFDSFLQ
jgi:pimeloyl-ACP methyl ester carboxylesterase